MVVVYGVFIVHGLSIIRSPEALRNPGGLVVGAILIGCGLAFGELPFAKAVKRNGLLFALAGTNHPSLKKCLIAILQVVGYYAVVGPVIIGLMALSFKPSPGVIESHWFDLTIVWSPIALIGMFAEFLWTKIAPNKTFDMVQP